MPRGRKAANEQTQAVAVVSERLPAPPDLSPLEQEEWCALVNAQPADKFGDHHRPIIKHHVRSAVLADMQAWRIQKHLAEHEKEGTICTAKEQAQFTNLVNSHLGLGKSLKMTTVTLGLAPYERKDGLKPKTPQANVWEE